MSVSVGNINADFQSTNTQTATNTGTTTVNNENEASAASAASSKIEGAKQDAGNLILAIILSILGGTVVGLGAGYLMYKKRIGPFA